MSIFDGITEFMAVAETQGFTAAAKRLGVSTSHVSRQVAALESRLGLALVARSTRKVKLTNAGVTYFEHCQDLVNGIDQANEIVTAGQIELSGVLRVTAAGEFAETNAIPALLEFIAQHPKLDLELDYNSRIINFVEDSFDFAIRFGSLPDSTLIARKLIDHQYAAAASQDYIDRFGLPETPQALINHACIVTTYNRWAFCDGDSTIEVNVNGRVKANSVRTVINACKAGLGIAYLPQSSFGNAFDSGALCKILVPYWENRGTTWIVYANRKYLPARARLAIEFLLSKFQES